MRKYILLSTFLSFATMISLAFILVKRQDEPKPITLEEFNKLTGQQNKTILVYFHADWCAVCRKMAPVIQKIDSIYSPRVELLRIDTEKDKEVAEYFEVNGLPVLMLYKNGDRKWTYTGLLSEKELRAKLDSYCTTSN